MNTENDENPLPSEDIVIRLSEAVEMLKISDQKLCNVEVILNKY